MVGGEPIFGSLRFPHSLEARSSRLATALRALGRGGQNLVSGFEAAHRAGTSRSASEQTERDAVEDQSGKRTTRVASAAAIAA